MNINSVFKGIIRWLQVRCRGKVANLFANIQLNFMPRKRAGSLTGRNSHVALISSTLETSFHAARLSKLEESELRTFMKSQDLLAEALIPVRRLYRLENHSILMPECVVLDGSKFLVESLPTLAYLDTFNFLQSWIRPHPKVGLNCGSSFLLGLPFQKNYHLWLTYALPRLIFWENLQNRDNIVCLVPTESPRFVVESLQLYQRIRSDFRFTEVRRGQLVVSDLYLAEPFSIEDLPNPVGVHWLRSTFCTTSQQPFRRLYLSRAGANERSIINEVELLNALAERDFELFDPSSSSFADQIKAFQEAEMIVSPHGAGLSNLTFSQKGVKVHEIVGGSHYFPCFRFLTQIVEGEYKVTVCSSIGPHIHITKHDMEKLLDRIDQQILA